MATAAADKDFESQYDRLDVDPRAKELVGTEPLTSTLTATSFRDLETQHSHALEAQFSADADDAYVNELSLRSVEPVSVKVRNLSVNVSIKPSAISKLFKKGLETKEVRILNDVSADMPSGQLTALIGASGSGKTSMLNVLSQRMKGANLAVSGNITFKNKPSLRDIQYAYVMQQDVLIPTLTVRETLTYSADLRLSASTTKEERKKVVEEVILELGLKECANTRIGDNDHKGCSGGEKRRVSIGVQLLANPSVLFLDEPTTGLDATSAHQLVKTLKNLAQKGRTIITTIHQPRSEIWDLFDRIILLGRGQPLYSGTRANALTYFASLGHDLPLHVNPADFLIDTSAIDSKTHEAEEASLTRVNALVSSWRAVSATTFTAVGTSPDSSAIAREDKKLLRKDSPRAPVWRQIDVMTRRTVKTTIRDPFGFSGSLIEATLMALVTGLVFLNLDRQLQGIRSREGAIYTACALQGYLVLLYETWRLSNVDIHVFDRERGEGIVGVTAFLISRRLGRLFLEDIPVPLVYSVICYFMNNLEREVGHFFIYFSVVLIGQFIAVSFAALCVAVSRNFAEASLIANLNFTLQSIACGYFIQSNTLPVYVRWCKWISYVYYGFGILINNEFKGNFYNCPTGGLNDPSCLEYNGDFIMTSLGVPQTWRVVPFMATVAYIFLFQICAGILLKFWAVDIHVSRQRPMSADSSAGKEKMRSHEEGEVTRIDVVLEDYKLSLVKYNLLGKRQLDFEILKGITTRFEAGSLNIVMGPSGSGKSSLLNLMAQRLHSSLLSRYHFSGSMLFNGARPSDSVIRSLCSYVTQDDDALLSSLTVRETLRFAAGLRLPKWISKSEKNRRAEEVILKMGLKDCADTVIGSEYVKGISGGEKRRVTIAVQVLTEPKILLLDEPTSGLDAFTAASILAVLRGLTEEGRTIICTIHQSRSDLFDQFGNILLLARGGSVVYSGTSQNMLPYFKMLGHDCPTNTNPADFALDLVTVDLQHEKKEARSRAKVQYLIDKHMQAPTAAIEHRTISLPAELGRLKREQAPFRVAYPILTHRSFINLFRQPQLVIARLMQVTGLGLVLALFFAPLKHDYYSVQNRLGFVQQILPLYFVGLLQNAALYPFERDVFYKEHDDGAYSVEAFIAAYLTNELPFEAVTSLIFGCLGCLAVGLPRTPKLFFVIVFNAFCITSCGESLGIMFNTLFSHTGFAINVTSTILSVSMFMAGIMSLNIPGFLKAFNYLSPVKYAVQNMLPFTLRGVQFTCTTAQEVNGVCPIRTGEEVLNTYGFNFNAELNLVWLAVATVSYRLVSWGVLRVTRMKLGVSVGGRGRGWMGRKKGTKVGDKEGKALGGLEDVEVEKRKEPH